jgi:hypothetical protein
MPRPKRIQNGVRNYLFRAQVSFFPERRTDRFRNTFETRVSQSCTLN